LRFFYQFLRQALSVLTALAAALSSLLRSRTALQVENLALRHQLGVLQRSAKGRPQLTAADRFLWAWLCGVWRGWRSALVIVNPETVVAWHRKGFRLFWTWKVRHGKPGRPISIGVDTSVSLHPTGANRLSLIHLGLTLTVTPHRLPTDYGLGGCCQGAHEVMYEYAHKMGLGLILVQSVIAELGL
jgi:hypothetical protein